MSSSSSTMASTPIGFVFAMWTAMLLLPASAAGFELPALFKPNANRPVGATAYSAQQPYQGYEIPLTSKFVFRPALFKIEGAVLGFCLLFLALHYVGKLRNRQLAERWAAKAMPIISEEFANVAGDENGKGLLMWNGGADAVIFASGRRGCQSMHTSFSLKPRHDPLERAYNFLWDIGMATTIASSRDVLTLTFTLPKASTGNPDNLSGVFALVDKTALQTTRSGRFDLSFTKVVDGDQAVTSRGLANKWAIMSESADLTDQFLGEPEAKGQSQRQKIGLAEVLGSDAGNFLESLVLTDQPAERPTDGPLPAEERERRLIFTLRVPTSSSECDASLPLLHLAVNLLDAFEKGVIRPRQETLSKFRKTRADVDKELHDEATKEQREAEEARAKAKRRAEKEKLEKLSPAEQARRKEVEKKRQMKKGGAKMKIR